VYVYYVSVTNGIFGDHVSVFLSFFGHILETGITTNGLHHWLALPVVQTCALDVAICKQ